MIENISTATPVEIDTELARLHGEYDQYQGSIDQLHRSIQKLESRDDVPGGAALLSDLRATVEREQAELDQFYNAEIKPLTDEFMRRGNFREGGWTRYWIVTNTNGHVHNTLGCSTCFPTTQFGWLTQVSGQTEDEIVRQAGVKACTVCFASAPSEYLARRCTLDTPERLAAQAAKDEEKAKKAADKAVKAITKPDGTPLYEFSDRLTGEAYETSYVIKTEVAARRKALEAAFNLKWYGTNHPQARAWLATEEACLQAIAAKIGVLALDLVNEIDKKAEAKYRKEMRG